MPSVFTLEGTTAKKVKEKPSEKEGCRCVPIKNKQGILTGRSVELCPVPKSKKHRNGLKIVGRC